MRRWAILVAALYAAILFFVVIPVFGAVTYHARGTAYSWNEISNYLSIGFNGGATDRVWYGGFMAVIILAQAALLAVPVNTAAKRPVTRRTILPLVIASALMMGLLAGGVTAAVLETVINSNTSTWYYAIWPVLLVFWALWAWIFFRWSSNAAPSHLVDQTCRALFKGSILGLLVAVPCHIIARHRDYCCAGMYTFLGIACGIAVMLFSFGPGVFFLFANRLGHLTSKSAEAGGDE